MRCVLADSKGVVPICCFPAPAVDFICCCRYLLVQVGCLDVHDEVPFRLHWPRYVDLRVNNMQYRTYMRAPNMKMGINQRDEPASIGERT